MKRYFDLEDFITFLNLLEDNKVTPLFTESVEDGSIEKHNFMKMMFSDNTIILYDHPMCQTGIIQERKNVNYSYRRYNGSIRC